MMDNSNELARIITDASASATSIVSRTLKELQDSTKNSVTQATISVAQTLKDLQQSTKGAVEQSKQVAVSTVSELLETHGMVRSDTTALFERLRDANGLLQDVLGGAQNNFSSIEQILSTRVAEFVSTVGKLLENTDNATGKLDRHVSSFYSLTSKVLGDLGDLAVHFDGHGKSLAEAVHLLEKTNFDTMASVNERKNAIEGLAAAVNARTEDLDERLKRFSGLLDQSLRAAEDRARDVARLVAEATSDGARTIAEQHAAIRLTTEQQSKQTLQSLHELYEQVSSESKGLFQQNAGESHQLLKQATDRFADIMHGMKQMSQDMQRELDNTREELRRGVLELPQETAESTAQMRRVIVDQMDALAELNRIVARHGRAMDTVAGAAEQPSARRGFRDEQPAVVSAGARPEPARPEVVRNEPIRLAAVRAEQSAPPRSRVEAPPVAPAVQNTGGPGDPGARGGGWLSDLLTRASRDGEETARNDDRAAFAPPRPISAKEQRAPRPDDHNVRHTIESLDSLSVDIARMIDHDAAAELWERYNRGERNVFTKRLYTMQGQKAFDEVRRRYKSDREFRQTVDRYIGEFERLLSEVSRDDRGQMVARTYLTSETGKVYTMLAHAAGRFD